MSSSIDSHTFNMTQYIKGTMVTHTYIGIGAFVGFLIFVGLLEGNGMGKILWREGEFSPRGLLKYMKSPFVQKYLWYPSLWRHNWIIMTFTGGLIGGLLSHYWG